MTTCVNIPRMENTPTTPTILVSQLRVGIYVCLDLNWMEHPFSFNNFKIRSQEQLDTLKSLGLRQVRYDPRKSDVKPAPPPPVGTPEPVEVETVVPVPDEVSSSKRARAERLKQHREAVARVEKAFLGAADTIRNINQNLFARPKETVKEASAFVRTMVEAFLSNPEVALHVMNEKAGGEDMYFHSLNVSVLSMMMARQLKLSPDLTQILGMGALFHDIGLIEIPSQILQKTEALTPAERDFRQLHCEYGVRIGEKAELPRPVLEIIAQHHEYMDGSGYPKGLKGDQINSLARIVATVNYYDNLCNPVDIMKAMTPHEALSMMYAQLRSKFDINTLQCLIHCLGVYPPGSIVKLSNETLAVVIALNPARPLRPTVVVYDPDVPREEAIILDLEFEPDINIAKAVRPGKLPRAVYDYLSPRKRVTYYFDARPDEGTAHKGA